MEREAQMPHQAVALELAHVAPQVHALILLVVALHEGVQQVVVDVAGAGALERGLELLARRALRRGHRGVKLGGKRVTLARMAVYQRFLDGLLRARIDMGSVNHAAAAVQECVKQEIQALDPHNPKAIKKYMDVYRNYKLKIMPSVQDEAYKLHTNEVFEIDAADELLIDKIEEAHLFSFSNNKGLNRMAIKSILYADNNSHGVPFGDYLPTTIHGTEYSYEEYRVGGEPRGRIKAVYPYDTESDSLIEMYFEFNETELLSIDNSLYD